MRRAMGGRVYLKTGSRVQLHFKTLERLALRALAVDHGFGILSSSDMVISKEDEDTIG